MLKNALIALFLLLAASAGQTQDSPLPDDVIQLRQMANQAHAQGDREAFRSIIAKLNRLRPNNSEYMYQRVLAHAALGELEQAFDMMLRMQRQGLSYDFDQSPDSENLRDTSLYDYLNDLLVRAGQPMGEAEVLFTLPQELGMVEAVDWDPGREAFLVGTVTDGRLLQVGRDGAQRELLRADSDNGLWGIYDVVVDPQRGRLWVSTAATAAFSGFDPIDAGRSALIEFDLESLELLGRYPVPVDGLPHNLGQMALAADGTLFFADRVLPIIYAKRPGEDRLHPVFAARNLVSLRGIDVSDDQRYLYAADYEMGILQLDLQTGEFQLVGQSDTLNLGGIEELVFVDGSLVIIQNGIRPQRIMRLELNESGTGIVNVAPVAVAQEWFDYPNYGTVVDGELYFFASSAGAGPGRAAEPVALRFARTGLEGVPSIVPPDMERFLERQAQQRMQRPGLEQTAEEPAETAADDEPDDDG